MTTKTEKLRSCRVCGCTDENCKQCIEKTGTPCHWVEQDLCSACVPVFKPILFSTEMVQAILEGRKTQTRRLKNLDQVNKKPDEWDCNGDFFDVGSWEFSDNVNMGHHPSIPDKKEWVKSPYRKGNILWVRETFCTPEKWDHWPPASLPKGVKFNYKADQDNDHIPKFLHKGKWRSSIHMPKIACRIFMEVTDVRVERLQDISEDDAIAEGIEKHYLLKEQGYKHYTRIDKFIPFTYPDAARTSFFSLWMSINGAESLDANPWVWVYDFKRVEKPENFLES